MPRPPLPVGTAGKIDFLTVGPRRVRARARFRDYDGITRPVTRFGPTRPAAERRLKEALRDRIGPTQGDITRETRVRALADRWLDEMKASDLREQSKALYERTLRTLVKPALGGLRIYESDVPAVDRFLKSVREHHGRGAAKTCKTVTSHLLAMAVRHGALSVNPVRDVAKIPRSSGRPKSLSAEEEVDILAKLATDQQAIDDDVPDVVEFMDGTGMRIGEVLGLRGIAVDLESKVLEVNATAVYIKGKGTILQERPKTAAGWRVIALPDHIVELCQRRMFKPAVMVDGTHRVWSKNEHGLLFPNSRGGVRHPTNANRAMCKALERISPGYTWVTTKTFRRTVATRLDEAGLTARQIADHLGHAQPSMTQDVYMGRGVAAADAALALARPA